MEDYMQAIVLGVVIGLIARLVLLKTDYRQYPTYPHGSIIHIALGLIAAGLGSIAVPALFEQEYAAITFLALAAQQFREVRNMERNTLSQLDQMEMVSRGNSYIEGIAMAFEGRNYLVILTSFLTSLSTVLFNVWVGVLVGIVAITVSYMYKSGQYLHHIAQFSLAEVRFEGPDLFVGPIHIMNVGVKRSREIILNKGIGVIITPKSMDSVITLANLGQRQAILHDLSVGLGIYRDQGNPSLVPLTRRNLEDGRVAVFFLPQIQNKERALQIVSKVPVLEQAVRIPSESDVSTERGGK